MKDGQFLLSITHAKFTSQFPPGRSGERYNATASLTGLACGAVRAVEQCYIFLLTLTISVEGDQTLSA